MLKEFTVPVWFTIRAQNAHDAEIRMRQIIAEWEAVEQVPDYDIGCTRTSDSS